MEKASKLTLKEDEKEYLKSIARSKTSLLQEVQNALILLLRGEGVTINVIANTVELPRNSVIMCIKKYKNGGIKSALCETPGRGRNSDFSDEEKDWIISIVTQRPINNGFPAEIWTYSRLTDFINEKAEEAGFSRLSTISRTSVVNILKQVGLKPKKIRYPEHLHRQYPDASTFYYRQHMIPDPASTKVYSND